MMKVVHVALTPLAGGPIRVVNALNQHTQFKSRLIVFDDLIYGERQFANDMIWRLDREEAIAELESADVVHFHHVLDLKSNNFKIDFTDVCSNARFLRQYHSAPLVIARGDKNMAREIVSSTVPQLVLAQFHERYYPYAKVVPNIVPINDESYLPALKNNQVPLISFSPSVENSCWSPSRGTCYTRWDTKGAYETVSAVKRAILKSGKGRLQYIVNKPHDVCLNLKRLSDITIDEIVTGSYHLSSLESLSHGLPTLAYLDDRTQSTIRMITGAEQLPWVNVMLEYADNVMVDLLGDPDLRQQIGHQSRQWMEKYYRDDVLVDYYCDAYQSLLEDGRVLLSPRYNLGDSSACWVAFGKYDAEWSSRLKSNSRRNFICKAKKVFAKNLFERSVDKSVPK